MANHARGESSIDVPGVGRVTLCLTLAGMAHLEDHFGVDNLGDAAAQMGDNPSSREIAEMIAALTMGGAKSYTANEVRQWPITIAQVNEAMGAMNAANESAAGNAPKPARKPPAKRTAGRRKKA